MSRKSKKDWQSTESQAGSSDSESAASVGEIDTSAPEVSAPEALTAPAPAPEYLDLNDAARRFVPGFQDRWWDGIRKHATTMGFGEGGTEEQCKSVLRHWGAKV